MRYHLTPVRMAKINNTRNNSVGEDVEKKGTFFITLLVRMQTGASTVENSMKASQKIKNGTNLQSNNGTTRYLPKKYKNTNLIGYMHPYDYCSTNLQ